MKTNKETTMNILTQTMAQIEELMEKVHSSTPDTDLDTLSPNLDGDELTQKLDEILWDKAGSAGAYNGVSGYTYLDNTGEFLLWTPMDDEGTPSFFTMTVEEVEEY